jgi:hypothetical protein
MMPSERAKRCLSSPLNTLSLLHSGKNCNDTGEVMHIFCGMPRSYVSWVVFSARTNFFARAKRIAAISRQISEIEWNAIFLLSQICAIKDCILVSIEILPVPPLACLKSFP